MKAVTLQQLKAIVTLQRGKPGDACTTCTARVEADPAGWLFLECVQGEPVRIAHETAQVFATLQEHPTKPHEFPPPKAATRSGSHWARCALCPTCRTTSNIGLDVDALR